MGGLISLRDRELVSGCKFYNGNSVFSGGSKVKASILIWFWSMVVRSLLIRDRELVFGPYLFWDNYGVFFDGPGVVRWWNPKKRWKRTLRGVKLGSVMVKSRCCLVLEGWFFFGRSGF